MILEGTVPDPHTIPVMIEDEVALLGVITSGEP